MPVYASTVDVGNVNGLHVHIGPGEVSNKNGGKYMTKSTSDGYEIYHDGVLVGRFYSDASNANEATLETGSVKVHDSVGNERGLLNYDSLTNTLAIRPLANAKGLTVGGGVGLYHGVFGGIWSGSKVIKSNGTSTPFMTASEFKSITGYGSPSIDWILLAQSADWNAYQGCINLGVQGSTINMYLSRSTTGNVRVNYFFLYSPNARV